MSEIKIVTTDELRRMKDEEGLVLQGCGGDLQEWIDGINDLLTNEGILFGDTKFSKVSVFKHEDLTNLLFHFTDDVKLHIGKLAVWRIATHDTFGGTWLSDYVDNRLGGFFMSGFEQQVEALNSFTDTEVSFDFQCDQTLGFPTCLCWNTEKGKAWLSPSSLADQSNTDMTAVRRACEAFGIRDCESVEDYNAILDSLGEDAKNCKIHDESEDIDLC